MTAWRIHAGQDWVYGCICMMAAAGWRLASAGPKPCALVLCPEH